MSLLRTASGSVDSVANDLFEYTSGRWIYNEHLRRAERRLSFNIDALKDVIAQAADRPSSELRSLTKLAEGGFNRILQATFQDGLQILARLPYSMVTPKCYTVASEVATLALLRMNDLPVPKVLQYCATAENPVGVEYILLEKIRGNSLGDKWFEMNNKSRKRVIERIVEIEKRLFSIRFSASGSLYYRRDLEAGENCIHVAGEPSAPGEIVIGPTAQHEWYYKERVGISSDRGPWRNFRDCFEAVARREIKWCEQYGKPRLHVERYLRELHNFQDMDPNTHKLLLEKYLKLAPSMDIRQDNPLSRPVLRHPDFSPNNIIVSETEEILGIIDWQHAAVLPLCLVAGIPKYFQNWGDPLSEKLAKPETELPDNFDQLAPEEQERIRHLQLKRLTHFLYAAGTMIKIPEHFYAINQYNAMLRARLYNLASSPWEGDSVSLKRVLIEASQKWPVSLDHNSTMRSDADTQSEEPRCPIEFSQEEVQECFREHQTQEEELQELHSMREYLDVDPQGWVPDDDHWGKSREMAKGIKAAMLEHAVKTEVTRKAVQEHFPFDDHEE